MQRTGISVHASRSTSPDVWRRNALPPLLPPAPPPRSPRARCGWRPSGPQAPAPSSARPPPSSARLKSRATCRTYVRARALVGQAILLARPRVQHLPTCTRTRSSAIEWNGADAAVRARPVGHGHQRRQVLSQVGYLCLGSIFLWVIIELIVQFGVRNSPNAVANQIPIGVNLPGYVNVRFRSLNGSRRERAGRDGGARATWLTLCSPFFGLWRCAPCAALGPGSVHWRCGRLPDTHQRGRADRGRHPHCHANGAVRHDGDWRFAPVQASSHRVAPDGRGRGTRVPAGTAPVGPQDNG